MQIKKINEDLQFINESFSNYRNWGHITRAIYQGREVARKKIIYLNRTWERYTFETSMACTVDILDRDKIVPLADRIQAYRTIKA